jgi:hypothetical protein
MPPKSGQGPSIVTGNRGFALILIRLIIFCIEFTVFLDQTRLQVTYDGG